LRLFLAAVVVLASVLPAIAQSGGMVRGVVRDDKGEPVENASVTIVMNDTKRKFETKTNRRGEFIQIGLASGAYSVTAAKDKLASTTNTVNVRAGQPAQTELVIGVAAAASSAEAVAKAAELKKVFDAGVAAGNAGKHDEAIAQFTQAAALSPTCYDCYNNIGFAHTQKKEYDQAEAAYKKAAEIKPDDAAAYNGLANIYNAQRKFDLAAQASAKAAELSGGAGGLGGGSGSADALFNQGVILWNGGKVAEAKKQFEAAIAANPNHAESHYQLGMALVNEGNLKGAAGEFETYLKLAPDGPNATQAKALLSQLPK
jgi:tetratricopeptide (TPR) repeat protein